MELSRTQNNNPKGRDSVKVTGFVSGTEAKELLQHSYEVLDISEAEFEYTETEGCQCLGMSHSGPVYSSRIVNHIEDALKELLSTVSSVTIILPDSIARKHMNVLLKNSNVHNVVVGENSKLFSMKDGDVYNKKGDKLVFKHSEPKFKECSYCGKQCEDSELHETAYGEHVCFDCIVKHELDYCVECGKYFKQEDMSTSYMGRCRKCDELW